MAPRHPLWSGSSWRCRAHGGYFSSGFARRGRGGACRGPRRCPRPSTCGARRRRGVAHVLVSTSRRRHDVDNEECRDAEVVGRGQARASADRDAGRHHRARASLPAGPRRRARCGRWRTRCSRHSSRRAAAPDRADTVRGRRKPCAGRHRHVHGGPVADLAPAHATVAGWAASNKSNLTFLRIFGQSDCAIRSKSFALLRNSFVEL